MKVTQEKKFGPITIVLETEEEAIKARSAVNSRSSSHTCNHDEILKAAGKMAVAASRVVRASMVDLYPAIVELEHAMNIYDTLIISQIQD